MFELKNYNDSRQLCTNAAQAWLRHIGEVSDGSRPYLVALSGGRIAVEFFAAVREHHLQGSRVPEWVHFFWADERCVGPDSADSNFRVAQEHLLQPLKIPAARIHRIRGEIEPRLSAEEAQRDLAALASGRLSPGNLPVLDMVFLGMGEDGHTASLFPGSATVAEAAQAYIPVVGPKPPPRRVSLTYQAITQAGEVWVLVSGSGKVDALVSSLKGDQELPLGRVLSSRERTTIWTDVFF